MNEYNEEFTNPNRNFDILMMELQNRIEKLRLDTIHCNDAEIKGLAEEKYTKLRIEYFKLMRDDLNLQKAFEDDINDQEE